MTSGLLMETIEKLINYSSQIRSNPIEINETGSTKFIGIIKKVICKNVPYLLHQNIFVGNGSIRYKYLNLLTVHLNLLDQLRKIFIYFWLCCVM